MNVQPQPVTASTRWTLDPSHSSAGFRVRHMMITNVRGEFQRFSAEVGYDPSRPEAITIDARIDAASIHTRNDERDEHLRSADFFDVAHHPEIAFVSRRAERVGDALDVTGELTIRGTTREVVLRVDEITAEHVDPWGQRRIGARARTSVRRSDFGITWNAALEAGGVLVSDAVAIELEISLVAKA